MRDMTQADTYHWLKDLAAAMRANGVVSLSIPDGTSITLGPVPKATTEVPKPVLPRRCACGHSLAQHNGAGICTSRNNDRSPCSGKCRIIEAGEVE